MKLGQPETKLVMMLANHIFKQAFLARHVPWARDQLMQQPKMAAVKQIQSELEKFKAVQKGIILWNPLLFT